jgi:hypothetical protein
LSIFDLLESKKHALRVNAQVTFIRPKPDEDFPIVLPETDTRYESPTDGRTSYISTASGGEDIGFMSQIPEFRSPSSGDFVLRLRLSISTVKDLALTLSKLNSTLGLSASGTFAIHQRTHAWYGCGAKEFLLAVSDWKNRYEHADLKNAHHSEELSYFDFSKGSLIAFSGRQRVADDFVFLHGSEIEVWLQGLPVDSKRLLEFCAFTGNDDAQFELTPYLSSKHFRLKSDKLVVQPIARLITKDKDLDWVSGVVVKNPFRRRSPNHKEIDQDLIKTLRRSEVLVCHLGQWHVAGDVVDRYFLTNVFSLWAGHIPVVNVMADWNKFVQRAPLPERDLKAIFDSLDINDIIEE